MHSKLVHTDPKVYVLVFDAGDEVMKGLETFCKENNVHAARFTAIGAFNKAKLGYFDLAIKDYKAIQVDEQVEVLSVIGDIVPYEDRPKVHAHAVLGKSDGTAHGGHLMAAFVNPTLEVVMTALPSYLHREMNEDIGIPLIKL